MNDLTTAEVSMTTTEIAERTGKEHRNVLRDTRGMLTELYGEESLLKFEQSFIASNGQTYPCYRLPKKEVLCLVAGYNVRLRMAIIERLEELETGLRGPVTILPETKAKARLDLELYVQDYLKTSDVSKLAIIHDVYKIHAIPTNLLPAYVEQTPVTFAAKDLLAEHNVGISSVAFNKLMIAHGFLEERERTGSKGRVKRYKALTDWGLAYGQNDTSPHNPREIRPHYYADKFKELLSIIL